MNRQQTNIEIVKIIAQRSSCKRAQVGAIITKDNRIISTGYNNPPMGKQNCDCDITERCEGTVHAEMNAILSAAKFGIAINGCTMYCTHSPCQSCAQNIIGSGIIKLHFLEYYDGFKEVDYFFLNMGMELMKV